MSGAGEQGDLLESLLRAANRGPVGMAVASVECALRGLDKLSPLESSERARPEVAVRNEEGVEKPCRSRREVSRHTAVSHLSSERSS